MRLMDLAACHQVLDLTGRFCRHYRCKDVVVREQRKVHAHMPSVLIMPLAREDQI
jgi:hypothetical protein